MRSVADAFIIARVASALDIDPVLVRIRRDVVETKGVLRETVRVQILSVMVMARADLPRIVGRAVKAAIKESGG